MLNKEEFKKVFDANFDAVRSFIFYRCGCEDGDRASDIAQDVFLKVWEKRESLDGSRIKPLLYKIAIDCCINNYRNELSRMNFRRRFAREDELDLSPEDGVIFRESVAAYAKALEDMPEMQRRVFLMSREDGLKYREIAGQLHVSVKTVEKHVSAALRYLKTKLL
jgi:RNA polymerase sigma-70 factor (ECF subfamily)